MEWTLAGIAPLIRPEKIPGVDSQVQKHCRFTGENLLLSRFHSVHTTIDLHRKIGAVFDYIF